MKELFIIIDRGYNFQEILNQCLNYFSCLKKMSIYINTKDNKTFKFAPSELEELIIIGKRFRNEDGLVFV